MNSIAVFFTILVATTILGQPVPMGPMNLMELIRFRSDRISTLAQAIQVAGLADALSKDGPYMIFAPINDAFRALPEGALAKLIAAPADLRKLLLRHVVKGNTSFNDLKAGELTNLDGSVLKIAVSDNKNVTVEGVRVYMPWNITAVTATNGVIHFIDRVLP